MVNSQSPPSREDIIQMVVKNMYSEKILNNSHRGDVVEMIVLSALDEKWKFVGLGWYPWDLQYGNGKDRIRIQVKQCAALQLWGKTIKTTLKFGWSKNSPRGFHKYYPTEEIEPEGWFCDIFVFGVHLDNDPDTADQVDPNIGTS